MSKLTTALLLKLLLLSNDLGSLIIDSTKIIIRHAKAHIKQIGWSIALLKRVAARTARRSKTRVLAGILNARRQAHRQVVAMQHLLHRLTRRIKQAWHTGKHAFRQTTHRLAHIVTKPVAKLARLSPRWPHRATFLTGFRYYKIVLLGAGGMIVGINIVFYSQHSLAKSINSSWDRIPNPRTINDFQMPAATLIYDQKGVLLYNSYTDTNRIPTSLQSLPHFLVEATLAAEDKRFYRHFGIDPVAFVRAALHNLVSDQKQGGSTLTQQVARSVFLTRQKTFSRKLVEAVIALRMERNLTKNQILELYFNTISYGGNAVGIEAAAQQYFGKSADKLTDKEALFLVSITPAPTTYGRDQSSDSLRIQYVLSQMKENRQITAQQYTDLLAAPLIFAPQITYKRAPHAVDYILSSLDKMFDDDTLNRGLVVKSSIDLETQNNFQQMVSEEVALHSKTYRFTNASALVVTPQDGRIISMVGSANYFDPRQGQVNLTTSLRQLGSTMKIVPYSYALEHGFTPETMIVDEPTTFKTYNNYTPRNYDNNFHGNISLKQAFANSYNVPALKVTYKLGVSNVAQFGAQMGVAEFAQLGEKPPLSLAIGGVETTLEHLAQAYQVIANQGNKVPLSIIDSVSDFQGRQLYTRQTESTPVVAPKTAAQIFGILSDPKARQSAFGQPSYFSFPKATVALKSGTSNNLRDNVTFAFTPSFVVATWVGNNDGSHMRNVASGYSGASVIMHKITSFLLANTAVTDSSETQKLAEGR